MTTSDKSKTALAASADPLTGEVLPFGTEPLQAASAYGVQHRVSDLIATPAAWAEYDQVKLDDWCNVDVIIHDVMFLDSIDREGQQWMIILFQPTDSDERLTMAAGGAVLLRKLHQLKEFKANGEVRNVLPVVGQFRAHPSRIRGQHDYYDLV